MQYHHEDGFHRRYALPDDPADRRHEGHHHHHHGRGGGRPFDYGALRLLVLALIAEQPRHGYELMKAIEERMGGSYSPSPGVMYPTLSWLDDSGYATPEADGPGRKRFRITPEGEAFLTANRTAVDALIARIGPARRGPPDGVPEPILQGMNRLKQALRRRHARGPIDPTAAEAIAAALDTAAQSVENT